MHNDRLCRWAGWGSPDHALSIDQRPKLQAYLADRLGHSLAQAAQPVPVTAIAAPSSRLSVAARSALEAALGSEFVVVDLADRLLHSLGKSYRDLWRAWSGQVDVVTDAVVYPADEAQIAAVLRLAGEHCLAVVPFGGGTSVVGGIEPLAGDQTAVVTLDLCRLRRIELDAQSHLATIQAGALGPEIERTLAERGFTLGHFPQSFEFSTLGGWIAPRGAGQQSTRFGKIEEIVQAVRLVTPQGTIETRNAPASAAGPSFLQCVLGSEGTLGVIFSAVCRVRPQAEAQRRLSLLLPDFATGCELFRRLRQAELPLSVVRLSDPEETRLMSKSSTGEPSLFNRLGKAYVERSVRRRGFDPMSLCLAVVTLEGSLAQVRAASRELRHLVGSVRHVSLGAGPTANWQRDRFRLPYLRDDLIARGLMVDTLETSTTWQNLLPTYQAVMAALDAGMRQQGTPGVAMCHLSHVYHSGSSLYFTFLAPRRSGQELAQWQHIKDAATRAILASGATLSHHHGIGFEHRPLASEHGSAAVAALVAAKRALDPAGVLNPGKLYLD